MSDETNRALLDEKRRLASHQEVKASIDDDVNARIRREAVGLAGAGAGGLTGGIIGALIGWGIPEERAKLYESYLKNGGIVLGVIPHNDDDAAYFEGEWKGYNGRNVYR
jgi:hypothetical protein